MLLGNISVIDPRVLGNFREMNFLSFLIFIFRVTARGDVFANGRLLLETDEILGQFACDDRLADRDKVGREKW